MESKVTIMPNERSRMAREDQTISAMIEIYCREKHGSRDSLCPQCSDLLAYARFRLEKCPFQEEKPTCANCPIHCYQPARKEQIRVVMRYAGPRMLLHHPILAIRHLWIDGQRKAPAVQRIMK